MPPSASERGIHRGWAGAVSGILLALLSLWLLGEPDEVLSGSGKTSNGDSGLLVKASYDLSQQVVQALEGEEVPGDVVIIYLDMDSHVALEQSPKRRWDRALHAELLERLTKAGPKAVVFDIIFDTEGPDSGMGTEERRKAVASDEALVRAIQKNGRVILAAEDTLAVHQSMGRERVESMGVQGPQQKFAAKAAGVGLATLAPDQDFTVRRLLETHPILLEPTLTRVTAGFLGLVSNPTRADQKWLRYYGPLKMKSVSYSTALRSGPELDPLFKDRVVFVGAQPIAGYFMDRRDELRNPLVSGKGRTAFMPAVEIHATQMMNWIRGEHLWRAAPWVERVALVLSGVGFGIILMRFRLVWSVGLGMVFGMGVLGMVPVGLASWDLWFPWLIPMAVQLPGAVFFNAIVESTDWFRHRRRHEVFRRQVELRLREQAALLDKAQDAIVVQDFEGRVLYSNPGATRLYGWDSESLLRDGLPPTAICVSDELRSQARAAALATGEWVGELEQMTKSGQRIYAQSRWTLIRDDGGAPTSLLMINTDHTEKKRLEARYLQAQRMEAVGAIAGGMAHDLNNALAPVLLGLEMLQRQPQTEDTVQMLEAMQSNARRGTDMVRQVLLFARGEEGAPELINVRQLMRETERMLRPMMPRTIALSSMVPGELWSIRFNSTRLCQVLVNLCLNARDAMPKGGTITLAVDNVEMDATEAAVIRGGKVGSYVAFTVADTGVGIAPENLEKIFEPFFTTKSADKGTGLGLTTVSHIVRAAGGFIHVESEVGVGTTFQVFLPRADVSNQTEMVRAVGDPRPCVVVVDDEHALHTLYSTTLETSGFRAVVVADTLEALTQIRRIGPARLAAVVIDGDLPGTDAQQLVEKVREQSSRMRVVWVRGRSIPPEIAQPFAVLERPVLAEALVEAVSTRD